MVRKKSPANDQVAEQSRTAITDEIEGGTAAHEPKPVNEIEGGTAAQEPKQWTKRRDPFDIDVFRWQDGYRISLNESDSNREIFVQFGSGAKPDAPKNFEAIRKMFKEEFGMYWDAKVQGWAKAL